MSFFWFVFPLFVVIFAYLGDETKTKNKLVSQLSRIFLLFTISIVLATCGSVYTDHEAYKNFYYWFTKTEGVDVSNIGEFFFSKTEASVSPLENGFAYLVWLIGKLNLTHIGFFFIIGAITNIFIIKSLYRFQYPVLVFLLYIMSVHFQQELNLIRQMLAVALVFYSLRYIEKCEWRKFLLLIIISFMFHQTSVIALPFLSLCFVKNSRNLWKIAKPVLMCLFVFSILVALRKLVFDLSSITMYFDIYEGYMDNEDRIGVGEQKIKPLYNLIVLLTLLRYKQENGKLIYIVFMVIGCVLNNLSIQAPNLSRIALYFTFAYIPMVPYLLGNCHLLKNRKVSSLCLYLYAAFYVSLLIKFILYGNHILGSKIENLF